MCALTLSVPRGATQAHLYQKSLPYPDSQYNCLDIQLLLIFVCFTYNKLSMGHISMRKRFFVRLSNYSKEWACGAPPPFGRLRVSIFVCKSCDTVLLTRYSARIIFICYHSANLGFLTLFRKLFPKFPNGS